MGSITTLLYKLFSLFISLNHEGILNYGVHFWTLFFLGLSSKYRESLEVRLIEKRC